MLKISSFKGGYDRNFCYVLYDEVSKEAAIIDLSLESGLMMPFLEKKGLKLKFAVVMHSHFDHLVGYEHYRKKKIPLCAHQSFRQETDRKLKDNGQLRLGGFSLTVMATPGHTNDAICLLAGGNLFTSDTLFIDGCGRCDLEGGDAGKMYHSLQRLKQLPDSTVIYPGHDYGFRPFDTLGSQKQRNKCLRCQSREEFCRDLNR